MDHRDHVNLIKGGVPGPGGVWADLGAGSGAFTLALAELVGPAADIYAVDRDGAALRANEHAMQRFGALAGPDAVPRVEYRVADFAEPLQLYELDGIVMANALHFQRDQPAVVSSVRKLVCVEAAGSSWSSTTSSAATAPSHIPCRGRAGSDWLQKLDSSARNCSRPGPAGSCTRSTRR